MNSSKITFFYLSLVISGAMLLVSVFFSSEFSQSLRYSREAMQQGQMWRSFTAHFVHLNFYHALLNTVPFVCVAYLFERYYSLGQWCFLSVVLTLGISLGLYVGSEGISWYVGFSGVLYGILAAACITGLIRKVWLCLLVVVGLTVKLFAEQRAGYDPYYMSQAIEGMVVVDAHLYGVLIGAVVALMFYSYNAIRGSGLQR